MEDILLKAFIAELDEPSVKERLSETPKPIKPKKLTVRRKIKKNLSNK